VTTRSANKAGEGDWIFIRRLLICVIVVGVAYTVWKISGVILLMFAAMLLAVILSLLADFAARSLRFSRKWTLPIITVSLTFVIVGFFWSFGSQIIREIAWVFDQGYTYFSDAAWDVIGLGGFRADYRDSERR
jgi:predicted PurR-regulated permease PerM